MVVEDGSLGSQSVQAGRVNPGISVSTQEAQVRLLQTMTMTFMVPIVAKRSRGASHWPTAGLQYSTRPGT